MVRDLDSPDPRAAHSSKLAEMKRLAADISAARAAMLDRAREEERQRPEQVQGLTPRSPEPGMETGLRRVVAVATNPRRIRRAVVRRAHLGATVAQACRDIVRGEGGVKQAARKGLGLLLRDGIPGIRNELHRDQKEPLEEQGLISGRPSWYSGDAPTVSIVVLNWNRSDLTLECIESLWQNTSGHKYEIVVVDNGSRDSDVEQFARIDGPCRIVRLGVNRYFGEGNNIGVESAKGEFVVLMNNDVTVTSGWLEPLMAQIVQNPECGAAGPKFLYPDGLLQEAGGLLDDEGRSVQRGKFQDPTLPEFNQVAVVDYVSAACCLMRRADFLGVLGFDMMYEPAYYEDADLCMKLGQRGLSTMYVPTSVVVHHESVTTSDASHGLKLTTISELNRMKFVRRWETYLTTGKHIPAAVPADMGPCDNDRGKPTMGVYTPFELTPGGGERYLFSLIAEGLAQGRSVHLVTPTAYSRIRVAAMASMFGLDLSGVCLDTLKEALSLQQPYDEWVALGNQLVPPAPALGNRNTLICQFPFKAGLEQWRARDKWLLQYERILCYSDFAADTIKLRLAQAHMPALPVEVLTPPVELTAHPIRAGKSGIISAGRFFVGDHSKRQDLQIEAFRALVEEGSATGATLHLVGSSSPDPRHRQFLTDCMHAAEGLDVQFHVDAPLATMNELYAASSVYWHSSGLGVDPLLEPERCEHFGITPIEAMSYGTIPVVVGHGGPAATVRDGVDGFHYQSIEELVTITAGLLSSSDEELRTMRESARTRAGGFNHDAFARAAAKLFDW